MTVSDSAARVMLFMGVFLRVPAAFSTGASVAPTAALKLTMTSMEQVRNRHAEKVGYTVEVFDPPLSASRQQVADLALRGAQVRSQGRLRAPREAQQFVDIRRQSCLRAFVSHHSLRH
jgi:hypothetical protein